MNVSSHRLWLTAALAVGFASLGVAQTRPEPTALEYVPGQIVVKFRPGFAGTARTTHAMINAKVKRDVSSLGYQTVQLRPGMSVEQAVKYYKGLVGVQSVSPNYKMKGTFTPNDPQYNRQWWLPKVNAPAAWDVTLGAPTVKIAVIDSGVDYNHEDLKGKVILGRDEVNNDADPMDDHFHGTHVAGIAAGTSNNGIGIAGLGFNCQIIAVKVLDETNVGGVDGIAAGIINAADLGAQVINLSLGGPGEVDIIRDALAYAARKDVVIVASAGNDNTTLESYPGADPECICVAATDEEDNRSGFSNYGAWWVDVAAPGSNIFSTLPNNSYGLLDGTSMAGPVVAGLAGLLRSYAPTADRNEIRNAIESTTVDVGDFVQFGRIDASAALATVNPPREIEGTVTAASIYGEGNVSQGRNMQGSIGDLSAADNKSVSIETIYVPANGSMASAQFTVNLPGATSDNFVDGTVAIRHTSRREATNSVFLYNYRTGRYDMIKSVPGQTTAVDTTVALTKRMKDYLSDGEVRVVVRAYISSRASKSATSFRLAVDRVKVDARIRVATDEE